MWQQFFSLDFLLISIVGICLFIGKPINAEISNKNEKNDDPIDNLEYSRYIKEVINVLESDPEFKKVMEGYSVDDIQSGKLAGQFELLNHNVRSQLDEIKRKEVSRLSQLVYRNIKINNVNPLEAKNLMSHHLDFQNKNFNSKDIEKLIKQVSKDLDDIDRRRKEEFKNYEMNKKLQRKRKIQQLDEMNRKRAEEERQKELEILKHHEKLNHPGSKLQLEEVWEKDDKLERDVFDPRTFFNLRDTNGDGFWDEFEIESLFQIELNKVYNPTDKNFDPVERDEEMNRMREHYMNEIDKDKNKIITLQEFMDSTQRKEFKENEEWKSIEDQTEFNDVEFASFSLSHETDNLVTTQSTDHV